MRLSLRVIRKYAPDKKCALLTTIPLVHHHPTLGIEDIHVSCVYMNCTWKVYVYELALQYDFIKASYFRCKPAPPSAWLSYGTYVPTNVTYLATC